MLYFEITKKTVRDGKTYFKMLKTLLVPNMDGEKVKKAFKDIGCNVTITKVTPNTSTEIEALLKHFKD